MRKPLLFAVIFAATVFSAGAQAATRDQLVVTPVWLGAHAADKDVVILHVGTEAGFNAGHIPGAHLVDGKLLQVSSPDLSVEVPPPDVLHQQMESLGISDNSHVIVYNETDEFQRATRVLFTLDVAGFGDHSSLLDGGLAEWKKTGHAASTEPTPAVAGHLAALKVQPRVVDADFVQSHAKAPGYNLIDARAAVFYGGLVAKMTGDGHIPGAKSLPYTSVYTSDGKLKSPAELKALFAAAGFKPGNHVVAYCQVGGQSSAVVFAARSVGIEPQLYDGSFQDWSKRKLPVETSNSPRFQYARQVTRVANVHLVSVFAAGPGGGNPAPVVMDAEGLGDGDMRAIAAAYGHESAFVLPPPAGSECDFALRFWVPHHEMEMCGHATVGAVWLLHRLGRLSRNHLSIATLSGAVEAQIHEDAQLRVEISQPKGQTAPLPDGARAELLSVLGIDESDLAAMPIRNAWTSRVKTLIPLKSTAILDALKPDFGRIEQFCEKIGSTGLYPFAASGLQTFDARQFPKSSGYPEDAATGIAAAALAFGLLEAGQVAPGDQPIRIRQGRAMGRPSQIAVRLRIGSDGMVSGCWLGGDVRLENAATGDVPDKILLPGG